MAKKEVKQYLTDVLINKIDYYVSIKKFDFDTIKEMLAIDLIDYEPYMIQTIDKYIKYIIWLDQKNKNKSEAFLKFLDKYQQDLDDNSSLVENKNSLETNSDNLNDYQQRKKHQTWLDQYFRKQKAKYHVYEESPLDSQTKINNFEEFLQDQTNEEQVEEILDKDLDLVNLITSDNTFYQNSTINLDDLKTNSDESLKDDLDDILLANQKLDELEEIELDPEEFGTATINIDKWEAQNGSKNNQEIKQEVEPTLDEQDLTKDSWIEEKDLTSDLIKKIDITKDSWIENDQQINTSLDQKLISEPIVHTPEELVNNNQVEELSKEHWIEENAHLNEEDFNKEHELSTEHWVEEKQEDKCECDKACDQNLEECFDETCDQKTCCEAENTCQKEQDCECEKQDKCSDDSCCEENKCSENNSCENKNCDENNSCSIEECKTDKCCIENKCCVDNSNCQEECNKKDDCECSVTNCDCQSSCDQKQEELTEQLDHNVSNQTKINKLWINQPETDLNKTNDQEPLIKTNQNINNKIWTISPETDLKEYSNDKDFLDSKTDQEIINKTNQTNDLVDQETNNLDATLSQTDQTSNNEVITNQQVALNPNKNNETPKVIELNKPVKLYQQVKWNDKTYYVVGIKIKKDVFGHEIPVLRLESQDKPYEITEVKFIKKY
ncbi:conserved hypothetical protein [synthetic Mycoplasma mycoides JCVI-syn1.0]|uniref:hypothetical protein n=1 Tax=Mycoplasma mycoides TaxID=2102 RepID=UPI0001793ECC|nr:hypothetical protein [Mycoplasma mycoides]ADH21736.1 conserved hypothetical protein [synthetic Mycoplasma mycoides JCVI-syn1.0]AMW76996.1 hypothetical protein JCVISYN2_0480 [synthetic bacterium JCVI-Syn2.0]ACU78523.1 conserved hypothetical protein [Mycoplasma mycoides subsp. capri str. GM12]ACU79354.1 conserved hypothetical protein [Mycoplasma mycoides subsp. capri str. GM12]SRX62141.1 hypothetical protein MMC68C_00473 [Mycoplasma mycoides subsp. capri]